MPLVVVLPGHGGFDPGAVNTTKRIRECDGTLSVCLKIATLLEAQGVDVLLSRTIDVACGGAKDTVQDITNQIRVVNSSKADIAVSVHFNSSINKTANGLEVLYSDLLYPNPNEKKLASLVLEELVIATKMRNRGLKTPDNASLIKKATIPCIISECGFISNDSECVWCSDNDKNWILAVAHVKAICRYFGISYLSDINENKWSYKAVRYCIDNNILNGMKNTQTGEILFRPDLPLTREQYAQAEYNKYLRSIGK